MGTLAIRSRWSALALLTLSVACGQPPAPAQTAATGEWLAFDGTWTASGTRTTLDFGPDRHTSILHLKGSLLLNGNNRVGVGFRAEVVNFSDTETGTVGRVVWTDERGDKLFSSIVAESIEPGRTIAGTFVGGTGRYAAVTGDYEFQWQYLMQSDDGSVSGRATGLKGRARLSPEGAAK